MARWLTEDGFEAPRAADFLTEIRSQVEAELGVTIDWSSDTVMALLTDIMADRLGEISQGVQALYDSFDPNNATGVQQDNLCTVVGVFREAATYSLVTLTITGDNDTIIPEGSLVEGGGDDDTERWATTEQVTIAAGTATVLARAQTAGAVIATAGEVDTIVTPVAGWTAVTNADAAEPGAALESNAALRRRRQRSLLQAGEGSPAAIQAALEALDAVVAAVVIENVDPEAATVEGIVMSGCSIAVIIWPDVLTDAEKQTIGETIYARHKAGNATSGTDVEVSVTGEDGYAKIVRFDYATEVPVTVAVTVTLLSGYVLADVDDDVIAAVTAYFDDELSVGDDVLVLQLLHDIAEVEGVKGATLTLNGVAADVTITLVQIATLNGVPTVTT